MQKSMSHSTYSSAWQAGLLRPLVGRSDHHIKNSQAFPRNLQSISLQETDIMVSFDVVSLFRKISEDTLQLPSRYPHKKNLLISQDTFSRPVASSSMVPFTTKRTGSPLPTSSAWSVLNSSSPEIGWVTGKTSGLLMLCEGVYVGQTWREVRRG